MAAQAAVPDDATLIQTINAAFQLFDKAKNGTCDERDVTTIIQALGLNPGVETADRLLEEMRTNGPAAAWHPLLSLRRAASWPEKMHLLLVFGAILSRCIFSWS
jgi:hypothetical protein